MKRFSVILLSIVIMCATFGSVFVFAAKSGDIVVGALEDAKPYSYDSKNENQQVLTYCVKEIFGNNASVKYKYYSSYVEMMTDLGKGDIDVAFPAGKYTTAEAEFGVDISEPVLYADMTAVFKGTFSDSKMKSIAVYTNSMGYYYAQAVYPEATKVFCDSPEDTLAAIKDGRATCALISDYNCSALKSDVEKDGELGTAELPFNMGVGFGVKSGDTEMLEKINKGIEDISSSELSARVYAIEDKDDKNVKESVEQIGIVGKIIIALVAIGVIFGAVYVAMVRSRKKVVTDRLNKQNQMLREAKMRQDEYNAATKRRKEELAELEAEISEKMILHKQESERLKAETESLQQKNEEMQLQTETLESLLLEKYVQMDEAERDFKEETEKKLAEYNQRVEDFERDFKEETEKKVAEYNQRIADYDQQIEEYNRQIEEYGKLEEYQKQLEDDILNKMELLGYEDLELEKLDIRTAIREILPDLKTMSKTAGVSFSLEVDEMDNPVVICDTEKLNRMIMDMLFVAMRNAHPESKVTLNIHQVGEGGGFGYYDYTCIFTGDTLDYSSHVTTNLRGVTKLQRMENGTTSIIISLRLPIMKEFMLKPKN